MNYIIVKNMFIHKVDENISLRLFYIEDAKELYVLTNNSRNYLRQWLPWVDYVKEVDDSKKFIEDCFKTYSEKQGYTIRKKLLVLLDLMMLI